MMHDEIFKIKLDKPFKKDLVEISFDFQFESISDVLTDDDSFMFPDEIFMVNVGEVEKFSADFIYQSKLVVFKDEDMINFGGYTPDFRRKADLLRDKNDNIRFNPYDKYHVLIAISKYRVYIDINNGKLIDSYGNGRLLIDELKFYARKDIKVKIENVKFSERNNPLYKLDKELQYALDNKFFVNYLSYHKDEYGLYFDRMNIIQNIKCTTRNSGQYDSNVMLDVYTNSCNVTIGYHIMDAEIRDYNFALGILVNGKHIDYKMKIVNKKDYYKDVIKLGKGPKRLTIVLPVSFTLAIDKLSFDKGSITTRVNKRKQALFLGDSITEGAECFDPSSTYVSRVTLAYNLKGFNQAISGRSFNDYNVLGTYKIKPNYVFIANGTNHFAMGTGNKEKIFDDLRKTMKIVIDSVHTFFPKAKIIAILPLWRSDEKGPNFTLQDTVEEMKKVYSQYQDIIVIDAHDYIPFDAKYFSNSELALHPNVLGHTIYGNKLIEDLSKYLGKPKKRNYCKDAIKALGDYHE